MSSGIQALLKTEKDAAEVVNEARKYRANRLKTAKSDAQVEIDNYKKGKEQELQQYEKEHDGLNENIEKEADAQVETELQAIKKSFQDKKTSVVKLIVDAATSPNPELHKNASK